MSDFVENLAQQGCPTHWETRGAARWKNYPCICGCLYHVICVALEEAEKIVNNETMFKSCACGLNGAKIAAAIAALREKE